LVGYQQGKPHCRVVLSRAVDDDIFILACVFADVGDQRAAERNRILAWANRHRGGDGLDAGLPARSRSCAQEQGAALLPVNVVDACPLAGERAHDGKLTCRRALRTATLGPSDYRYHEKPP
jgi:hypothetical protein